MYCQLYTTSNVSSSATLISSTQSNGLPYNVSYSYGYALYPQDKGSTAITWTAAPTGNAASCDAMSANSSYYGDANGVNYTLACNYDVLNAADVGNAKAKDFYSCMPLCDAFPGCSGYSWLAQLSTCYFKNLTGASITPQSNSYVDMAWVGASYAGYSASTVAAPVVFKTTTTAWTGASTVTTTQMSGTTAYVYVKTPGAAAPTGTYYVTSAADSGTGAAPSTTTITPTGGASKGTVIINYPTPVTTCSNYGIKYGLYTNFPSMTSKAATASYPAFLPQNFKTVTPKVTGTATYLAENNALSGSATIYGTMYPSPTPQYGVINHVFYVYAGRGTGYYAFNLPYTDDITLLWMGPKALSGWNRTNADTFLSSVGMTNGAGNTANPVSPPTVAFYLTQGTYTPVRVMWGNAGGNGDLQLNVYAPDGSTILASTGGANAGSSSPNIVQFPCNSTLGSAFLPFGSET